MFEFVAIFVLLVIALYLTWNLFLNNTEKYTTSKLKKESSYIGGKVLGPRRRKKIHFSDSVKLRVLNNGEIEEMTKKLEEPWDSHL